MGFSTLGLMFVALGGALGAVLRHLSAIAGWGPFRGIMLVNVLGSVALGVVVALSDRIAPGLTLVLGAGLCGALTTYSTLAVQTYEVWQRDRVAALRYLGLTTILGLMGAMLPLLLLSS
ncbi:CrcB family protein [Ornithinimicrobium sp. INDO-MA30-4]|uniref:fluoride efflux transporter FluC n=1 Tax=Ornithinimicrobium sp. INDO-MA30-4 TaxID=2908651 RepID=UPI001F351BD6|nr:CrcB family protein [Ornithinimicrobium sp. INDO-MA30-4]UJH70538.1 CrcB family protein [Ornithinimicrobium sp. INDO-MA30-4]